MNARAKTRNVDLIRNIVLDELVTELAMSYSDGESRVHLNEALLGEHSLIKVLERLQITVPRGRRVAGLTVERSYWMEHIPSEHIDGEKAPGHPTEGLVAEVCDEEAAPPEG